MSDDQSQLGVLQALEDGRIDVREAVRRLEGVPARRLRRSQGWWLIPLGVGMAFLGGGGMLASLGSWWWLAAIPLLLIGTLLTILAAGSSTSAWIFSSVFGRLVAIRSVCGCRSRCGLQRGGYRSPGPGCVGWT